MAEEILKRVLTVANEIIINDFNKRSASMLAAVGAVAAHVEGSPKVDISIEVIKCPPQETLSNLSSPENHKDYSDFKDGIKTGQEKLSNILNNVTLPSVVLEFEPVSIDNAIEQCADNYKAAGAKRSQKLARNF